MPWRNEKAPCKRELIRLLKESPGGMIIPPNQIPRMQAKKNPTAVMNTRIITFK